MARLALLWHLHQPDYRDPETGRPVLPWTRLHALRGYRDLAVESAEQGVAATINLVPSLLDQLLWYASGGDDDHLMLTERPAADLLPVEIAEIRATFVAGHATMIDIHPDYARLRGRLADAIELDTAELRDLQLWSTLAWFGATALADFPTLASLRAKGRGFSEQDKTAMLAVQRQILRDLPSRLAAMASGPTRLATSPYYHPILPLLIDVKHARRCLPDVPDEVEFAWPDDAMLQLRRARARLREVLGVRTVGLWPSEGSVSPEVVALAGLAGFRWLGSDEAVLNRSRRDPGPNNGGWDLGEGVTGFFRDRDLSDRIGFHYSRRNGAEAAAELLYEVGRRGGDGVITVALDGENPWESYPDAGRAFREALFQGLRDGPVRGISLDDAATLAPVGRVHELHTGSWIGADFRIWFGHSDDRLAWNLVADARRAIASESDPARRSDALDKLLPAEGSDWTWWYGDEFSTSCSHVFDALFRKHVRAAWLALGRTPPAALDHPVVAPRTRSGD